MNIENLKILADYLAALPKDYEHFDMGVFCKEEDSISKRARELEPEEAKNVCGSSMCAVGHGPNAGLEPQKSESWIEYAERTFGRYWWDRTMQWCFSGGWDGSFPSIDHAIDRLCFVVKSGEAPDEFLDLDSPDFNGRPAANYNYDEFEQVPA